MRFWVIALLLCVGLSAWHSLPFPTAHVLAPDEPVQRMLAPGEATPWNYEGENFQPLATYSIRARVLSRESYYLDRAAGIAPLDLALGWGRMSDPRVYDKLGISQGGRWYEYHWFGEPPIPHGEIAHSSANTHIIPASLAVRTKLFWIKEGDVVQLDGYLVRVQWPDGATWTSSLSRLDTGNHACEIMWVRDVRVVAR